MPHLDVDQQKQELSPQSPPNSFFEQGFTDDLSDKSKRYTLLCRIAPHFSRSEAMQLPVLQTTRIDVSQVLQEACQGEFTFEFGHTNEWASDCDWLSKWHRVAESLQLDIYTAPGVPTR